MPSTRDLSGLPDIGALRDRVQEMAALEAVYAIEHDAACYAFDPEWAPPSQRLGSYNNGLGDELFVHFTQDGCFIKGFAHESAMTPYRTEPAKLWPGLLQGVPRQFEASLNEPAFDPASTTFVVWRLASDDAWRTSEVDYPDHPDPDGSNDLLSRLMLDSRAFGEWLSENYEVEVDQAIVDKVFQHEPLTNDSLAALDADTKVNALRQAIGQTGYPL